MEEDGDAALEDAGGGGPAEDLLHPHGEHRRAVPGPLQADAAAGGDLEALGGLAVQRLADGPGELVEDGVGEGVGGEGVEAAVAAAQVGEALARVGKARSGFDRPPGDQELGAGNSAAALNRQ